MVEPSVPESVTVLLAVNVFPSAIVSVEPVAGAVTVTLLYLPPVISPVVSAMVTAEFWITLPVVPSNLATALSVAEDGPITPLAT